MSSPESGHDTLFRHSLAIPEVVRQFLCAWLPSEFLALVEWSSLKIEKISGINQSLSERREDLVYRVDVAGCPVCFYVLIEHQSTPDPFMPLRVLEYVTLVWQNHRKNPASAPRDRLPVVIPIVLYPGPGRWVAPRRLRDLIEIPEKLSQWIDSFSPDCGYCTIELAGLPMQRLADGATARAVLSALQAERTGDLNFEAVRSIIAELFADHDQATALQVADHLWTYLLYHSELQSGQIGEIIRSTTPAEKTSDFMSTAELLRQEGRQEGRQEAILATLELRFCDVPPGLCEAVRSVSDITRLEALHRASVTCQSLEDFAASL